MIKWPEFKHVCGDWNGVSYREGWNSCLEACKKAVDEGGLKQLATLNQEGVRADLIKGGLQPHIAGALASIICVKYGGTAMKAITNFCQLEELDSNELYNEWLLITGWKHEFDPNKTLSHFEITKLVNDFVDLICSKFGLPADVEVPSLADIDKALDCIVADSELCVSTIQALSEIKKGIRELRKAIHARLTKR